MRPKGFQVILRESSPVAYPAIFVGMLDRPHTRDHRGYCGARQTEPKSSLCDRLNAIVQKEAKTIDVLDDFLLARAGEVLVSPIPFRKCR